MAAQFLWRRWFAGRGAGFVHTFDGLGLRVFPAHGLYWRQAGAADGGGVTR